MLPTPHHIKSTTMWSTNLVKMSYDCFIALEHQNILAAEKQLTV